jgi:hypothetical protein
MLGKRGMMQDKITEMYNTVADGDLIIREREVGALQDVE